MRHLTIRSAVLAALLAASFAAPTAAWAVDGDAAAGRHVGDPLGPGTDDGGETDALGAADAQDGLAEAARCADHRDMTREAGRRAGGWIRHERNGGCGLTPRSHRARRR